MIARSTAGCAPEWLSLPKLLRCVMETSLMGRLRPHVSELSPEVWFGDVCPLPDISTSPTPADQPRPSAPWLGPLQIVWKWQRAHYPVQVAATMHRFLFRLPQPPHNDAGFRRCKVAAG